MKKSSYEVRARRFIEQLWPFMHNCHCPEQFESAVDNFNTFYHRKVIFAYGLTRVAFVTSDYVIKLEYSPDDICVFGGCEDEVSLYRRAEKDGFAYMFAKIERYAYRGLNFYIMPRIHGIERTEYNAEDYMTDAELDWCDSQGLTDLHNGNYGWKNGHIVIIDYAARC